MQTYYFQKGVTFLLWKSNSWFTLGKPGSVVDFMELGVKGKNSVHVGYLTAKSLKMVFRDNRFSWHSKLTPFRVTFVFHRLQRRACYWFPQSLSPFRNLLVFGGEWLSLTFRIKKDWLMGIVWASYQGFSIFQMPDTDDVWWQRAGMYCLCSTKKDNDLLSFIMISICLSGKRSLIQQFTQTSQELQ